MTDPADLEHRVEELEAIARLTLDAGRIVDAAYNDILGRRPDRVGREHWISFLECGGSVAEMVALFEMSPEANQGGS